MSNEIPQNSKNGKVGIKMFLGVIGILVTIFLAIFGIQMAQINKVDARVLGIEAKDTAIQIQLTRIETNVDWLISNFKELTK